MSKVDLVSLKTAIKTALDANNVEGASPFFDISTGMTKRVKRVLTVNPENIKPLANNLPAICVYVLNKRPQPKSIGPNQTTVKRQGKIIIQIAGIVWNANYLSNKENDPADSDLEHLMENIEELLRNYPQIDGVKWQFPTDVTYHAASFDEETHLRVGFLDLELTAFY